MWASGLCQNSQGHTFFFSDKLNPDPVASPKQELAGGQSKEPLKNVLGESSSESLGSNKGETSGFVPVGRGGAFEALGRARRKILKYFMLF